MKIEGVDRVNIADLFKDLRPRAPREKTPSETGTGKENTPGQQQNKTYQAAELNHAVDQLNNTMQAYSTKLRFSVHEESGEMMVRVINEQDDTVIREIPPEKVLEMVAYFKKVLGIMVDKLI